jgi:phosphatidylglycerol:prolipoprotein diacylglycerol transferase
MLQIIFHIPFLNLPVYGYGLMLVLAFLACMHVSKRMAGQIGIDGEVFINATLIALVTGVAGSRLSHVLENWSEYSNPARTFAENFLDAVNIRSGGLTFYGGLFLATPCCLAYMIKKGLPIKKSIDIAAVCVMIGMGIGRIGCYLNGCCYGEICRPTYGSALTEFPYYSNPYIDQFHQGLLNPPPELVNMSITGAQTLKNPDQVKAENLTELASQQHSLPVQPTQLYSAFTALLLAILLWSYWTMPHLDGRVFALMMILEGPARFLLEMIRVEPAVLTGKFAGIPVSMSLSMVLGMTVFVAGLVMWAALGLGKTLRNDGFIVAAH